jgi:hypothetical protein
MNSISKFAVAALAALTVASLASAVASAHGGGGGGGGGGGHGGGFGGSMGSAGHASPASGYSHAHFPAGRFGRSSVVPRLVGSADKNHRRIPTQTLISQFPKGPTTIQDPNHNHPRRGWGWDGYATVDVTADCVIKRYLPNGRVLFTDVCTGETVLSR